MATAAWRIAAAFAVVAVVLTLSSGGHRIGQGLAWLGEALAGAAVGITVGRWLTPASWYDGYAWRAVLYIAVIVAVPIGGLELFQAGQANHGALSLATGARVVPEVFLVTLGMTALAFLVRPKPAQTHAAPADAPPPKFLDRLPEKLRGAEVWAVEAEDHYLRLHTSRGQDLILLRLGDAIAELEGIEGAQTHRSWWVARAAVTHAERGDGRAILTLKDGAEAPVSRGYARVLREAGWF